jgi:hypothetical protein
MLSRVTDGFFSDPSTGRVVLVESPNVPMKALAAVLAVGRALRRTHVVDPGDPGDALLERTAMAMLIWWSVHELRHGTTKYLRTMGAVTLAGAVARTLLADPVYGLSATRGRAPAPFGQ